MFYDIAPLLKSHRVDLNRFQANIIDAMRIGSNGTLYGLPFNVQLFMMMYNKDIFDKFGVAYPTDDMTWTQAELAKKVTRLETGIQYRGLDPNTIWRLGLPLSQVMIDGKTNKVQVNNDQWKRIFQLGYSIFTIPGNGPTSNPFNDFAKDKRLAMLATYNQFAQMDTPTREGLNWDIVQYPSYEERPNTYGLANPWMMFISKQSKYKDQAMQVLGVLTSDEVQLVSARKEAKQSPLTNPLMTKEFGADVPFLKGKNIAGIFKSQPAPAPAYSEYYEKSQPILVKNFNEYIEGKKDVNTALRETEEQLNNLITERK